MRLVPPVIAREHSLDAIARQEVLIATRDKEHAVSIVIVGPVNTNWWEIRPLKNARQVPSIEYAFDGW